MNVILLNSAYTILPALQQYDRTICVHSGTIAETSICQTTILHFKRSMKGITLVSLQIINV
jgi:hypothetical protein